MRLSLCILFTIWGIFSVQPAQAALHLSDVAFLEDFCDAVVGLPATWVKTSALDACVTPPWLGITCQTFGSSQRIIAINLSVRGLTGKLPPSLGNLTQLASLDLSGNNLSGPIPETLGSLAELSVANLQRNSFSSGIPAAICGATKLTELNLSGNPGVGGQIPNCIGQLVAMQKLNLGFTGLSGTIPNSITSMTQLSELRIRFTSIEGTIPDGLADMNSLVTLALNDNNLVGSIPSFCRSGGSPKLKDLQLQRNMLNSTIPTSLSSCSVLWKVILRENFLTCNTALITLTATYCTLDHNLLSGPTTPFDKPPCADLLPSICLTGPSRIVAPSTVLMNAYSTPYGNLTFTMMPNYPSVSIGTGGDASSSNFFFVRLNISQLGEYTRATPPVGVSDVNFVQLNASTPSNNLVWSLSRQVITISGVAREILTYETMYGIGTIRIPFIVTGDEEQDLWIHRSFSKTLAHGIKYGFEVVGYSYTTVVPTGWWKALTILLELDSNLATSLVGYNFSPEGSVNPGYRYDMAFVGRDGVTGVLSAPLNSVLDDLFSTDYAIGFPSEEDFAAIFAPVKVVRARSFLPLASRIYYDPDFSVLFVPTPDSPPEDFNTSLAVGLGVGLSIAVVLVSLVVILAIPPIRHRVFPFLARSVNTQELTSTVRNETTPTWSEKRDTWVRGGKPREVHNWEHQ